MPFARPTLRDLISRAQLDISSRIKGTDPALRISLLNALARQHSGAVHGLYGYMGFIADQILPETMSEENFTRYAEWRGVPRIDASAATGPASVTGTDGRPIAKGTVIQRTDGFQYTVDTDATIIGTTASLSLTAVIAGIDGNLDPGSTLTIASPIPGISSTVTVTGTGLSGGAEIENLDDWKAREKAIEQAPPQGGNGDDYIKWAKSVAGVTRVWPFNNWIGPGSVGVYFMRDNDPVPIPNAAEVAAVQAAIDIKRPWGMGRGVTVYAPTANPVDLTIQLSPNDSATQAAVQAELADLFLSEAQVEDGKGSGTILRSHINEAISRASGEFDHVLVVPAANVTIAAGEISQLGNITWQPIP